LNIPTCANWTQTGAASAGNPNGTAGPGLGSLAGAASMFIDNNFNLYISDRDNNRIVKYYPNATVGVIVAGNGTAGNDPSELNGPKGVAVDQYGSIVVADSNNYRIQKFLVNSTVGITLASNTSFNPLGQMRDLHIDLNNNIYVTDSDNNQVVKYIPFSAIGIVVAGGAPAGSALNQLRNPFGNFVDNSGTIYVADDGNQRILKFPSGSLNGTIVAGINYTAGANLNELNGPISVTVDNNGYVKIYLFNLTEI
jgi:sugar lactone lactonase YvrE